MGVENNIPEDWVETSIGKVTVVESGGTPSTKNSSYWGDEIPWITPRDLSSFKDVFIEKGDRSISIEGLENSSAKLLPKNTILFSSRAPIGYVVIAQNEAATNQGFKNLICDEVNSHFKYFYYLMKYKADFIERLSSGSTFSEASGTLIKSIELYLPPLPEQKAIANVLTAFDDKIELLQAQNKTLETMAQTIFKEWFGKYKIGDDLPEGWSFSPLYSIARYINGAAFKSQDFSKDKTGLPIVKIVELKNGITDSTAFSKKVVDSKYYIDDGDILFSWSGSPETSIDVFLWSSGKAILNQHSFNVKVDDDNEKAWVYFLLKYKKSLFIHLAKMKQTTGLGHVTISDLKENHFATPPKDDRKRFGKVFNGFLQKIMTNQSQIQSLRKTRDTLLPKLMSGQVRVKNLKQTADA